MSRPDTVQHCTGVVLAGGKAQRMGGVNKALLRHQGRYLLEYAVQNLQPHCDDILVNANTEQERFESLGYRVIDDGPYLHKGPLAGLHAALEATSSEVVLISACDQLMLPCEVYAGLKKRASQGRSVFASDGRSPHPVCAAVTRALLPELRKRLDHAQLRLLPFMQQHCEVITFPDVDFHNINTQAQRRPEERE